MKNAVLIIAHKNKNQLLRLIKTLDDKELDVFVHLDKKWKLSSKDINELKHAASNINIIDKRISGYLDTWSLCQITIELAKEAIKNNSNYCYFLLLSGQDYPIKSMKYIKKYLENEYPKPIIDCTPMTKNNWIYSGFKWIRIHRYYRFVEKIAKNKITRKILLLPAYFLQIFITIIMKSPYKRLKKIDCKLYGGSAWWILPNKIILDCINEVESNSEIVKAFKLKNTPEETFFQTMAMKSKYKNIIDVNASDAVLQNCMTYAYFFDDEHEPTGHPYILRKDNFNMLKSRKELFARKFDTEVDSEILDVIDEYIGVKRCEY